MGKNVGKNISKNLSSKYSQKRFHHAKQSATDALKTTFTKAIQIAEATGDFIGNKNSKYNYKKNHYKILQRQLKVKQKDKYLQKKDIKLLMN